MADDFLQNGCNCVTVINKEDLTIKDFNNLFAPCPGECQPLRLIDIDGHHAIVLPDCMNTIMKGWIPK